MMYKIFPKLISHQNTSNELSYLFKDPISPSLSDLVFYAKSVQYDSRNIETLRSLVWFAMVQYR